MFLLVKTRRTINALYQLSYHGMGRDLDSNQEPRAPHAKEQLLTRLRVGEGN